MADLLDLDVRRRLYALVREYPGLHLREAARQLETSLALVEYHAALLRENGLVREESDGRLQRLFAIGEAPDGGAPAPTKAERQILARLRGRIALRIVLLLLDQETPLQHKAICDTLGLGKSKLSFHLRKLEGAGIVRRATDGRFALVSRARLMRLLLTYQPTPDVRSEFGDVWLSFYGEGGR